MIRTVSFKVEKHHESIPTFVICLLNIVESNLMRKRVLAIKLEVKVLMLKDSLRILGPCHLDPDCHFL